ncbi:hypothetical protein ACODT3_23925 [Streptomyces sp. 4.24]|uniref:hypothetical protein n=1 Tax=Streptomyces tritrimontium TaxID=3406573 RepID=UPI003BB5A64A
MLDAGGDGLLHEGVDGSGLGVEEDGAHSGEGAGEGGRIGEVAVDGAGCVGLAGCEAVRDAGGGEEGGETAGDGAAAAGDEDLRHGFFPVLVPVLD